MSRIVFAYGSNMCTSRIKERTPSARKLGIGQLNEHRLSFHKRGVDGSGKADVVFTGRPSDSVHGVLWKIDEREMPALDRAERNYQRQALPIVASEDKSFVAEVYRAEPQTLDEELRPFDWYLNFVVSGAREHGLPDHYRLSLEKTESRRDLDELRRERNLKLVGLPV